MKSDLNGRIYSLILHVQINMINMYKIMSLIEVSEIHNSI